MERPQECGGGPRRQNRKRLKKKKICSPLRTYSQAKLILHVMTFIHRQKYSICGPLCFWSEYCKFSLEQIKSTHFVKTCNNKHILEHKGSLFYFFKRANWFMSFQLIELFWAKAGTEVAIETDKPYVVRRLWYGLGLKWICCKNVKLMFRIFNTENEAITHWLSALCWLVPSVRSDSLTVSKLQAVLFVMCLLFAHQMGRSSSDSAPVGVGVGGIITNEWRLFFPGSTRSV